MPNIPALLVLVFSISYSTSLKLPTYIKPCKVDENLNKCALESGTNAFPSFINGDPTYGIPNLNPLLVEEAKIPGSGLDLTFSNIKIHGLKDVQPRGLKFDVKKSHIEADLFFPQVAIDCDYKVNGNILVLPISGNGKANITLVDLELKYITDYTKDKSRDGEEHLKVANPDFQYKVSRAYFDLDNLFDGDKSLSDLTLKFLDENWQDVVKEMGPPIVEILKEISTTILNNIGSKVPFKDFWAE